MKFLTINFEIMQIAHSVECFRDGWELDQTHILEFLYEQKLDSLYLAIRRENLVDGIFIAALFFQIANMQNLWRRVNDHIFILLESETVQIADIDILLVFFSESDLIIIRVKNLNLTLHKFHIVHKILRVVRLFLCLVFNQTCLLSAHENHSQNITEIAEHVIQLFHIQVHVFQPPHVNHSRFLIF